MGGGPSRTRKLTVENEDTSDVIKLSDDVVGRLKGNQKTEKGVRSIANPGRTRPVTVVPSDVPLGVIPHYYHEPILTSLQIRQAKEDALKKNDMYWEQRITDLESVHGEMNEVMETEYNKAVEEVKAGDTKNTCFTTPCQNTKKAVIECYKMYPKEPMRCAKEVEAFAQCVDVQRATIISNKG